MDANYRTSVVDVPCNSGDQNDADQIGIDRYKSALEKFIENSETPLTIALQGEWGSGKTSLMNALRKELKKKQFITIELNTWHYALMATPEETLIGILTCITNKLAKEAPNVPMELAKKITKFCALFAIGFTAAYIKKVEALGKGFDKATEDLSEGRPSVEELKAEIKKLIHIVLESTKRKGVVFFIDDLDRMNPPVAVQVLELLKNIFDLEKSIFVLAIDYDVVVKGLIPKYGRLTAANEREFRSFFDKIIQLPFRMPIGMYQTDSLLISSLIKVGFLQQNEEKAEIAINLNRIAQQTIGRNPRSLKRLINSLSLTHLMLDANTRHPNLKFDKELHFTLTCIQIVYPMIYNMLQDFPDFTQWDEKILANKFSLSLPSDKEKELFGTMFDNCEEWEGLLYRICCKDEFYKKHFDEITRTLNDIKSHIFNDRHNQIDGVAGGESVLLAEAIRRTISFSSVTNVQSSIAEADEASINFHLPSRLRDLCERLITQVNGLTDKSCTAYTEQTRFQAKISLKCHVADRSFAHSIEYYIDFQNGEEKNKKYIHLWMWHPLFIGKTSQSLDQLEDALKVPGATNKCKESVLQLKNAFGLSKLEMNIGVDGFAIQSLFPCEFDNKGWISNECILKYAAFLSKISSLLDKLLEECRYAPSFNCFKELVHRCRSKESIKPFLTPWIYNVNDFVCDNFKYQGAHFSFDSWYFENGKEQWRFVFFDRIEKSVDVLHLVAKQCGLIDKGFEFNEQQSRYIKEGVSNDQVFELHNFVLNQLRLFSESKCT